MNLFSFIHRDERVVTATHLQNFIYYRSLVSQHCSVGSASYTVLRQDAQCYQYQNEQGTNDG